MNTVIKTLLFFALCKVIFAGSTYACSLAPSHLGASNYEIVRNAELIILAKAESLAPPEKNAAPDDSPNRSKVRFSVLEVLKGSFNAQTVDISGRIDNYHGRSDARDFSKTRPGAGAGACMAYDYKPGAIFLLLLRNHKGKWHTSGGAFSRVNEEVLRNNSPWTSAVKRYIQISQLDDYEKEKDALQATITLQNQSIETSAMVRDLENHFKIVSIHKSLDDLKGILNRPSQEEWVRQKVLWAMARAHAKSAKPIFEKLLANGKWEDYPGQISMYLASNGRKDMLPMLIDHFSKNSDYIARMDEKYELSEVERTLVRKRRKGLSAILKSIVILTDKSDAKPIFNKLLEMRNENTMHSLNLWITKEKPSLKSEFVEVLEKIANSDNGNEAAKRFLTYLRD